MQLSFATMQNTCLVCDTPANTAAPNAHIAQDWPMHKAYCKRVRAATNTFDAILFGVNEIQTSAWTLADAGKRAMARWQRLLSLFFLCWDVRELLDQRVPDQPLHSECHQGKAPHPWAGNVLALRSEGLRSLDWYNDAIIEEDLAPLVRFFEDYGKEDNPSVRVNNAVGSKKRENAQVATDIDTASASVTTEPSTADLKPFAFVLFVFLFFMDHARLNGSIILRKY
ncbi:uncharacterized protein EV420DRAFT_1597646 [Desarmillaria tabescens]|uniref:MYND-type domain-containing protein n=1 Tax=Armillaria tabescens TaxID=1929756 RepID=A0AA39J2U9_ARMTA|nr:uncharacterized protein EV420DRAFT_1597646 [Desarmillaria tabescens]KAK0434262.1 hypothetical protein EV420DRAFT_1597646 [Desarmillaria tabescens]